MIIARVESLTLSKGMVDAIKRNNAYIEAGADAVMIDSKQSDASEVFEYCDLYKKIDRAVPLIVVPTSYNGVSENELIAAGVKIVIYANQLLGAAYPAMLKVARSILENGRSFECEEDCMSISQIFNLNPMQEN